MKSMQKSILLPYDKYQRLLNHTPPQTFESQTNETTRDIVSHENSNDLTIGDILDALPKRYHQKAKAILTYMSRDHTLSWNDRGELVYKGTTIPKSHIVDLLKDTQYHHKNFTPEGSTEFYEGLKEIHIPTTLLVRREVTPEQKQVIRPPGLPAEKRLKKWIHVS